MRKDRNHVMQNKLVRRRQKELKDLIIRIFKSNPNERAELKRQYDLLSAELKAFTKPNQIGD